MEIVRLEKTERMLRYGIDVVIGVYVNDEYAGIIYANSYSLVPQGEKYKLHLLSDESIVFMTLCKSATIEKDLDNHYSVSIIK